MQELMWVMIGVFVIVAVSLAVSYYLEHQYLKNAEMQKDIFIGRMKDDEMPVEWAMEELKLKNSITDVSFVQKKRED